MFIVAFGNLCNTVDLQDPFMDKYVNEKSNNKFKSILVNASYE